MYKSILRNNIGSKIVYLLSLQILPLVWSNRKPPSPETTSKVTTTPQFAVKMSPQPKHHHQTSNKRVSLSKVCSKQSIKHRRLRSLTELVPCRVSFSATELCFRSATVNVRGWFARAQARTTAWRHWGWNYVMPMSLPCSWRSFTNIGGWGKCERIY